jgi:hypothetical protein
MLALERNDPLTKELSWYMIEEGCSAFNELGEIVRLWSFSKDVDWAKFLLFQGAQVNRIVEAGNPVGYNKRRTCLVFQKMV